jgi:hypothetical protein
MQHYKDNKGNVHFLDDNKFAHLLPEGSVPITDKEAEALRPQPPEPDYRALRAQAYRNESDPLRNEADFDSLISGTEPDYSAWIAKVQEIKLRYPKPDEVAA